MSELSMYIEKGMQCTKTLSAEPGKHPEVEVIYRPALSVARLDHQYAMKKGSSEWTVFENGLLAKHVISINGKPISVTDADRIRPDLRSKIIDLVLGFAGCDTETVPTTDD